MLGSVLFILCAAAVPFAVIAFQRSANMLGHIPSAERMVRRDANAFAMAVIVLGALCWVSTIVKGVPAFYGVVLSIGLILMSVVAGIETLRYARKHLRAAA